MEKLCETCEQRENCQTPCKAVNAILWEDNHVMERHFSDAIVVFPGNTKERHFAELTDKQLAEISELDVIPWSSGDMNFTQTKVFIERFFNKVPCKELAKLYGVKENTIVCMYKHAVERLAKIIKTMDARREGIKAMKPQTFTDDQKLFLLVHVFGFSQIEVATMFNMDRNKVNMVVKRMADRYAALFKDPVKSVYNGLSKDEMVKRMTGQ